MLTHQTALAFWRSPHAVAAERLRRQGSAASVPTALARFDIGAVQRLVSVSGDVHVMVRNSGGMHRRAGVRVHASGCDLPPSALCFVDVENLGRIGVVSPEVCVGQMGRSMPIEDVLLLAFEFCGWYRRAVPVFDAGTGSFCRYATDFDCAPVTSVDRLRHFSEVLPASVFSAPSRRAIRYALDGSGSPVESMLAALLTLPGVRGGYGLPAPVLNPPVSIPGRSAVLDPGGRYYCDLCWPDKKVAIEYDSNQEHTSAERITHDAIRYNNLKTLGYEVLIATWGQLRSVRETDRLAASVASALGVRLRIRVRDYRAKQLALRRALGF